MANLSKRIVIVPSGDVAGDYQIVELHNILSGYHLGQQLTEEQAGQILSRGIAIWVRGRRPNDY